MSATHFLIPIRWTTNLRTNCSGSCIRSSSLDMLIVNEFICEFGLSFAHANCIRMSVDWVNLKIRFATLQSPSLKCQMSILFFTFVNNITLPAAAVANEIAIIKVTNPTRIPAVVPSNWLRAVNYLFFFVGKMFFIFDFNGKFTSDETTVSWSRYTNRLND